MFVRANIEKLIWDSEFFAIPVARLTDINEPGAPLLINDSFTDYKLIQAKIPADDYVALNGLQNTGFQIADGEIDFEIKIDSASETDKHSLVLATKADIPQLRELAANAFRLSRFRSPWFREQDNRRFYALWAEKSVFGTYDDFCLTIKDEQQVIKGFVTLRRLNDSEMRVGLLCVNSDYRKQGIGEALVNNAISWCRKHQAGCLRIATQTGNTAALRLYIKCGATVAGSSYWLYRSTQE